MAIANGGAAPNYATIRGGRQQSEGMGHGEPALPLQGGAARFDGRGKEDDYTQAGNLFRLMPATEQHSCSTTWPVR
jgi:catalase